MGALKFRLNPPDLATRVPELRKAFVTGQDRTPGRVAGQVQPGSLGLQRAGPESGRGPVPWPVPGLGRPFLATATLAERAHVYDLGVELARGRLNDIRNQAGDWELMGLEITPEFDARIAEAQRAFAKA